ncbi:MAG: VTC domain-containing protein [Candidatus Melainabacteria bacterium]|jgi:hypothetical protein|nr:VTC domain-containing protein [Candidatus Melainabacteria bacterium]
MKLESNHQKKSDARSFEYYEYKYLVDDINLNSVLEYLRSSSYNIDPYPEGWVSSLYYDSFDQKAFYECEDGDNLKRKFRIRFYSDTDFSNGGEIQVKEKQLSAVYKYKSKFKPQEVSDVLSLPWPGRHPAKQSFASDVDKKKVGTVQSTSSASEDAEDFCSNYIESMPIRSLAANYLQLEPLILVKYYRYRFRVFDVRITLDTQISFEPGSSLRGTRRNFGRVPFSILEVKTESERPFLPTNKLIDLPQLSFSKFYSGVQYLKGEDEFFNKYL